MARRGVDLPHPEEHMSFVITGVQGTLAVRVIHGERGHLSATPRFVRNFCSGPGATTAFAGAHDGLIRGVTNCGQRALAATAAESTAP